MSEMIRNRHFRIFWQLTALAVILPMMVLQAMAASGAIHKHFHDHADDHGHECAVTLMLQGGYDDEVPDAVVVDFIPEQPQIAVEVPVEQECEPSHLVGGVLAHGPPRGP